MDRGHPDVVSVRIKTALKSILTLIKNNDLETQSKSKAALSGKVVHAADGSENRGVVPC